MTSPFSRPEPQPLPFVLKPLEYCAYRLQGNDGPELCDVFASQVLEGMAFCSGHARVIEAELETENQRRITGG